METVQLKTARRNLKERHYFPKDFFGDGIHSKNTLCFAIFSLRISLLKTLNQYMLH